MRILGRTPLATLISSSLVLALSGCYDTTIEEKSVDLGAELASDVAVNFINRHDPMRTNLSISARSAIENNGTVESYSVSFADGGFVIVSTQEGNPVLAYDLDSGLDTNNATLNQLINGYALDANHRQATGTISIKNVETVVEPLIQTNWNQSGGYSPDFTYNNMTPLFGNERAPVGCTAVAFGQILKFYDFPKTGLSYNRYCSSGNSTYNCYDGEILEVNFSNTTYDWQNMPTKLNYSSTGEQVDAVSQLLYHIGVALNVRYGAEGSSAQIANPSVFRNFRKHFRMTDVEKVMRSAYSEAEWVELIKNEVRQGRPVVLSGFNSKVNAGHAYIIDGIDANGKVHVNWGWGGSANGYYDLTTLSLSNGLSFTEDLMAFIKFTPNIEPENAACNGEGSLRCADGLKCVSEETGTLIDYLNSDETGVCLAELPEVTEPGTPAEPVETETYTSVFENAVAKDAWVELGAFSSLESIKVEMTGDADADLYVRRGEKPTAEQYDCRPYKSGSNEACELDGEATYYVSVNGWAPTSNFKVTVTGQRIVTEENDADLSSVQ